MRGEKAREGNRYNQNFGGRFCGCGDEYDPDVEKGTMFQCLGLGTVVDGGCGEDWWHPECLMGLPRVKHELKPTVAESGGLETVKEEGEDGEAQPNTTGTAVEEQHAHDDALPPGFPDEDDFEHLICYKCVNAFPWIKAYARAPGFMTAGQPVQTTRHHEHTATRTPAESTATLKRKAEDDPEDEQETKRSKSDPSVDAPSDEPPPTNGDPNPKHATLPPAPSMSYPTLFLKDQFRSTLCRCPTCFPLLAKHPQLLEEEDSYEPPVSEPTPSNAALSITGRSVNSGSLLERGEAALSGIDRVRAIEGVMAYNHVRDKVKQFLQPFAESGQAVGAEDIKSYFAKLRGDEAAGREGVVAAEDGVKGDGRREQGGY